MALQLYRSWIDYHPLEHNVNSKPGKVHVKFCNRVCISSNKSVGAIEERRYTSQKLL